MVCGVNSKLYTLMAITSNASYIPTCDEFIAHWQMAFLANGQNPVRVRDNFGRADLIALRDKLDQEGRVLRQKINDREFVRGDINILSKALVERLVQFNNRVKVLFPEGSRYVNALPLVPDPHAASSKVIEPLDDAANIWNRINQQGDDIILAGGYTHGQFYDQITQLRAKYAEYNQAMVEERVQRGARNETQELIYPRLKQYRELIPTLFPADSNIVATMPRLTPLPGSTPQPVNASAVWDGALQKARLVWDASDNPKLKEYQVRYSVGSKYDETDATVVATITPTNPLELLTDAGLTQVGAVATYKIFVIVETGNEAGSESLVVTALAAEVTP